MFTLKPRFFIIYRLATLQHRCRLSAAVLQLFNAAQISFMQAKKNSNDYFFAR